MNERAKSGHSSFTKKAGSSLLKTICHYASYKPQYASNQHLINMARRARFNKKPPVFYFIVRCDPDSPDESLKFSLLEVVTAKQIAERAREIMGILEGQIFITTTKAKIYEVKMEIDDLDEDWESYQAHRAKKAEKIAWASRLEELKAVLIADPGKYKYVGSFLLPYQDEDKENSDSIPMCTK